MAAQCVPTSPKAPLCGLASRSPRYYAPSVVRAALLLRRYNIAGYPTLKVFRESEVSDFTGAKTADGEPTVQVQMWLA